MRRRRGRARELGGPYDQKVIAARVEQRRRELGVSVADVCARCGLNQWDWSRKARCKGSRFTIEELSAAADALRAPIGWPWIDEHLSAIIERACAPPAEGSAPRPPADRQAERAAARGRKQ